MPKSTKKPKREPRPLCSGVKAATGEPCKLHAGYGTDHPGYGRCKYHGGSSPTGRKHAASIAAKYAIAVEDLVDDPDLHVLIERVKRRADVTDLTDDLALARALVLHYVNRAEALEQALLRWSESWNPAWQEATFEIIDELRIAQADEDWERYGELIKKVPDPMAFMQRPRKITDMVMAVQRLRDVASMVQVIQAQQEVGSIPARDVQALLAEVASVTERAVRDAVRDVPTRTGLLQAIETGWAQIRLLTWEEAERGDTEAIDRLSRRGFDA